MLSTFYYVILSVVFFSISIPSELSNMWMNSDPIPSFILDCSSGYIWGLWEFLWTNPLLPWHSPLVLPFNQYPSYITVDLKIKEILILNFLIHSHSLPHCMYNLQRNSMPRRLVPNPHLYTAQLFLSVRPYYLSEKRRQVYFGPWFYRVLIHHNRSIMAEMLESW